MSAMHPQAGGQYVYLREAFGRLTAFLFGWTNLTIINAASIAALAFISVEYLARVCGMDIANGGPAYKAIAIGIIAFFTFANAVGVLWGARLQNLLTVMKLLALGAIIFGMFLPGRIQFGNLDPFWSARSLSPGSSLLDGFKKAFVAIFWAYDGWYLLSFSGGEIRNPRRNIPLGFVLGMLVVVSVYVLANLAYLGAIPVEEMARLDAPLGGVGAVVAERFYGPVGLTMISVGILGSTLGAANGNILTGPRLFYAMARDGLFFRPFAEVHPRFLTPLSAIVVQGILSVLCVFAGNFDDLTDSVVFAAWIFYGLTVIGLFVLRRRHVDAERSFRMPGYPILPLLFVAFAAWFVFFNAQEALSKVEGALDAYCREIAGFWPPKTGRLELTGLYPLFVTVVILLGLPLYFFFQHRAPAGNGGPGLRLRTRRAGRASL
jgi:APA family basic amino acid/polyamine antiporter